MLATLKRCVALLPRSTRGRWVALVPLLLLVAMLEAVGAAAVFALIGLVMEPAQASTMPLVGTILGRLPALDGRGIVVGGAVLVGLFYVAKNAIGVVSAWARARCVQASTAATSVALLGAYMAAPWSFHLRRNSADLIHDVHQAVQRVYTTVMAAVLGVVTESFVTLGIVVVLLVAAPGVTLMAVTVLLVLSLLLLRLTRGATVRLGARLDRLNATALRHLQQALGAVKELKVLGREPGLVDAYARDRGGLADVGARYETLAALPRLFVETVFVAGALLVVILLTVGGRTAGETVPLLGLYAYAGFRIIPAANRIVWLIGEIRFGSAAVERVHRDLEALGPSPSAPEDTCVFRDRLTIEHVSFAHEPGEGPALRDVDLVVRRGEVLGILGPTGAGKSTLVDLVVGLLEPTAGRVAVDGTDLRTCVGAWRRGIGYVPQTVFLLDDTLRRNVALGLPDAAVDEERLREAVRLAQLDAFVATLPAGLDTRVGEGGARLSGGERQRVGIARALYGRPQVLVFDEATSALDGATEAALVDALDALRRETTILVVAHRPSSLRHCDRLVLLREGRVVDVGTFDELAARRAELQALDATPNVG